MTQRSDADLKSQLATLWPDNTSEEISPADSRSVVTDVIDSKIHVNATSDNLTEGVTNKFLTASNLDTVLVLAGSLSSSRSGNTLTITGTDTNTQLTNEQVQDIVGTMLQVTGNGTGTYDDTNGRYTIHVTGGGGGGSAFAPSQSNLYGSVKSIAVAGTGITITADDANHTLTFSASGGTPVNPPAEHEQAYFASAASITDNAITNYDLTTFHSADVQTLGSQFTMWDETGNNADGNDNRSGIYLASQRYLVLLVPANRDGDTLEIHDVATNVSTKGDYTQLLNKRTIGGQAYNVYYWQNTLSLAVYRLDNVRVATE